MQNFIPVSSNKFYKEIVRFSIMNNMIENFYTAYD